MEKAVLAGGEDSLGLWVGSHSPSDCPHPALWKPSWGLGGGSGSAGPPHVLLLQPLPGAGPTTGLQSHEVLRGEVQSVTSEYGWYIPKGFRNFPNLYGQKCGGR